MYRKDSANIPRRSILQSALASILTLSAVATPAHAQQAVSSANPVSVHYYDLKPGPLVQTLDAIAATSGRPIVFDRGELNKGTARRVTGNFSAGAAISHAIDGAGFILNEDNVGTLVVTRAPVVEIFAKRDQAETEFKADRSDTATRSGTSLHLVPGSVTLITSKVLESQQSTDLVDALRNVSGMKFNQTPQDSTTFGIRGFRSTSNTNGLQDKTAATRSVYSVERVEVLKGPQAILSGGNSLGGAVNIVIKKPQAETIRDLIFQYGSFNDKTVAVDLSGAVTADKRFTYRTIASVRDADRTETGMNGKKGKSFTQAFRWKDKTTDFVINADYTNDDIPLPAYTFARRDGVILPLPDRLLGNRNDGFSANVRRYGYQFEQALGRNVMLISRMQMASEDFDLHAPSPAGLAYARDAAPNSPLPGIAFYASRTLQHNETTGGDHYLRMNFSTGDVRQKLAVGFNHSNLTLHQTASNGPSVTVPVYSDTLYEFQDLRDRTPTPSYISDSGQRQRAIYMQDLISYEKWNLLLNMRRNRYLVPDSSATYFSTGGDFVSATPATTIYHTSPGAGIVYKFNDDVSLYASYAEGFVPFTSISCSRGVVPPNLTRNREVGAKFDLLDSRFTLTTSLFSLQQSNTLVYDRINNCYNTRDAQRSRGLEIDAQGRLLPGLDAIFNYTYAQVSDKGAATTVFPGQPKHKMNLWAVYKFQSPELKGLGAGAGVTASSNSLGNYSARDQFIVPGGAQVDASLYYAVDPWSLTFGVKNVFDRVLYSTATTNAFVPVLPGRVFALTAKRSFK